MCEEHLGQRFVLRALLFFFFSRNIRNAVSILALSQAGNFLYPVAWTQI